MTVQKIKELLDAQVLCGESLLEREVHTACGSDMMSDVLAFVKEQAVLLTGDRKSTRLNSSHPK